MQLRPPEDQWIWRCYVDEAGDPMLFNRKGRVIVGREGCSRYFILGSLQVPDPDALARDLEDLRLSLLQDPYFKNVPSLQPEQRKTAVFFHAKDDLPEVRREVFRVLARHPMKFLAVVRRKEAVLAYVRRRNVSEPTYRYHPNELYDSLVGTLFHERLHKRRNCHIYFARRGQADRTRTLLQVLERAQRPSARKRQTRGRSQIRVTAASPRGLTPLQAADYFLWALYRLYDRREDRFLSLLWPHVRFIADLDDRRVKPYGSYYTQRLPLTAESLRGMPEI